MGFFCSKLIYWVFSFEMIDEGLNLLSFDGILRVRDPRDDPHLVALALAEAFEEVGVGE